MKEEPVRISEKRMVQRLLEAVVVQAARDYRCACRELRRRPHSYEARKMKQETERFFCSPEFRLYTEKISGKRLLKILERKMERENERKN